MSELMLVSGSGRPLQTVTRGLSRSIFFLLLFFTSGVSSGFHRLDHLVKARVKLHVDLVELLFVG